ncbi:MAG: hypothetical protein JW951_02080, partial [Lentisphaerae bacterium]|nr:hypothetical protein [Lentisphaerota bacterium]
PTVSRRYVTTRSPAVRAPQPYEPYRPRELGGMTIAEWMKRNEQNNPELRARQERLRRFQQSQADEE